MFYSSQLLSRKSPLGIVWLASHSEGKKLKRTQLYDFSIVSSCESIINPEAPLALRLSGQLLLGVVRIYSRKLAFLETDARNAIDGLQRKDGTAVSVDLPDGGIAAERSITLNRKNTMGAGANNANLLFPSFDVSGGFSEGARTSTSSAYTLAEDISDVFGSTRWTGSEDRFANSELFSTELERLRDAQVAVDDQGENNNLFMDDMMDAPLPELFEQPGSLMVDPGKTPRSVAGVEGEKDRGNLETVGMFQHDEGWGYDDYGGMDDVMGDVDAALPSPATPDNQPTKKKKKLQLDEDIVLDDDEVKRLLRNRSSLVRRRGGGGESEAPHLLSESDRKRLVSVSLDGTFGWLFVEPKKNKQTDNGAARDGGGAFEQADPADQPVFDDFGYDDYGGGGAPDEYFEDPLGPMALTPARDSPQPGVEDPALPADGFTARTQSVLKQMRERGTKVSLNELVENKSRLEACRWFFESLVLRNKGYVDLEQHEPYGDIEIAML